MSLNLFLEEHFAGVFMNTDHFATSVIRYIDGAQANAKAITAIVTVHPAFIEDGRGRGYVHKADMVLASDVTINPTDAIKYDGNRYEIESVGAAEHGMRTVNLVRYQPESKGAKPVRNGAF